MSIDELEKLTIDIQRYEMVYNCNSEITRMQKRPFGLYVKYRTAKKTMDNLIAEVKRLKAENEKAKCCSSCASFYPEYCNHYKETRGVNCKYWERWE